MKKGDRVTIYMPSCPMAVVAMLACARIGAIHTVVFAGFSSVALADRIQDGKNAAFFSLFYFSFLFSDQYDVQKYEYA